MVVTELDKGKDVDENQASKHRLALLLTLILNTSLWQVWGH